MKYLAFDFGGTNIKYGLVSPNGKINQSWLEPVPATYRELLAFIHKKSTSFGEIMGIGISSPGIFDLQTEKMTGSSALAYIIGEKLKRDLEEVISVPISIENDGNCALLGEFWQGNAKDAHSAAIFVIGSAVGGSILLNSTILRGAHHNAGELGYSLVDNQPRKEQYGSLGGKVGFHALLTFSHEQGYSFTDGESLLLACETNQALEKRMMEQLSYLASSILSLQYSLDPQVILIGGGVSQNQYFMRLVNKAMQKLLQARPNHLVHPVVLPAKHGNEANLLGAIYQLQQVYFGVNKTKIKTI